MTACAAPRATIPPSPRPPRPPRRGSVRPGRCGAGRYRLWSTEGPATLAGALLAGDAPGAVLRDAGLAGDLSEGVFAERALGLACAVVARAKGAEAERLGRCLIALFEGLRVPPPRSGAGGGVAGPLDGRRAVAGPSPRGAEPARPADRRPRSRGGALDGGQPRDAGRRRGGRWRCCGGGAAERVDRGPTMYPERAKSAGARPRSCRRARRSPGARPRSGAPSAPVPAFARRDASA